MTSEIHNEEYVWENGSGQEIKLKDMDQSYISNCIRLIKKHPGWRDEMLEPLEYELKLRLNRWTTSPFKRKTKL